MKSILLAWALSISLQGAASAQGVASVEPLAQGLYKITVDGGWEATVVAFVGVDGLLIVDSGFKSTAEALQATLDSLGHGRPRYLINTHSHKDHTGGNSLLGRGAVVIAQRGMTSKLGMGTLVMEDYTPDALPDIGIEDEATLNFNGEEIVVKAFPGAHDATDLIVWFKNAGVAYLGDLAYGMHFPSTDYYTGSLTRYPGVISAILDYLPPGTRIVSGHGRDYSYQEMVTFRDMLAQTQEIIARQALQGHTAREIVASGLLDGWKSYSDPGMVDTEAYVATTLRDLQHQPVPAKNILGALYTVAKTGDGEAIYDEYRRLEASDPTVYGLTLEGFRPVIVSYLYLLGERLTDEKRYADALGVYRILADDYPEVRDTPPLLDRIGEAHLALYDFTSARRTFARVLELDPNDDNAKSRLALLEQLAHPGPPTGS